MARIARSRHVTYGNMFGSGARRHLIWRLGIWQWTLHDVAEDDEVLIAKGHSFTARGLDRRMDRLWRKYAK